MRSNKIFTFGLFAVVLITSVVIYFNFFGSRNYLPFKPYGYGFKSFRLTQSKGEVDNFGLLDHQGVFHELYRYSNKKAIVVISQGNDCPIIQKFAIRISELEKKYGKQNIQFFLLNSNRQDSRQAIIDESKSYGFNLPILIDHSQLFAEQLGISRTAEVVVLDPQSWNLLYRGAIDDRLSYGVDKQVARNNFLADVLESIVNDKPINVVAQPAKGCLITFDKPVSLSYSKVIAPILQNKCLSCHNVESGYLPILDEYTKVKNWSSMIKETILSDRMPPWSSDPHYGKYSNDISLSSDEKRVLVKWIDAGMPKEESEVDPLKSYKPVKTNNDFLKTLNKVYSVSMPKPQEIEPIGTTEYIYTQLGGPAPRDMWISAIDYKTTNPRQIHHAAIIISSRPLTYFENIINERRSRLPKITEEQRQNGNIFPFIQSAIKNMQIEENPNYFRSQVWAAGKPALSLFANGTYMYVPQGSFIILQSHYMGTGKKETEFTNIDFYQKKVLPKNPTQLHTHQIARFKFQIPPQAATFNLSTEEWITDNDILIYTLLGHLHMRGKAIKLTYVEPASSEEKTLASIPNFYYGWQTGSGLEFQKPFKIKKGSRLRVYCTYDNSAQNPNNPDPSQSVFYGQRVDRSEMCMVSIGYSILKTH